jgi:pimeloyl-ACP methyl ester carboxylesterase
MNQPENEGERFQEFNAQNFNSLFDAADYIRLLLRFLGSHPTLQARPVVIVGESYGGTRATAMLHILLNYRDYANGTEVYQDPALAQEIQNHLEAVFPEYTGLTVPAEVIAQQFGHQVLIQPTISFGYQLEIQDEMFRQPGSPLYKIGEEVGVPFDPQAYPDVYYFLENVANRDPYIYPKPYNWLNGFFSKAGLLLRTVQNLSQVTGVEVTSIGELYASARRNAYRFITASSNAGDEPSSSDPIIQELFEIPARLEDQNVLVEPGDISQIFGTLQPWDQYFLTSNGPANWAFHVFNIAMVRGYDIHFYENRYGRMFLKNLAYVQTFITNAPLDLVVYAAALAPSLGRHTELVSSVEHVTSGPEARPGQIVVHYLPHVFPEIPDLTSRTIRFPVYAQSAHAVSLTQPLDFYQDVSSWLRDHGIDLP